MLEAPKVLSDVLSIIEESDKLAGTFVSQYEIERNSIVYINSEAVRANYQIGERTLRELMQSGQLFLGRYTDVIMERMADQHQMLQLNSDPTSAITVYQQHVEVRGNIIRINETTRHLLNNAISIDPLFKDRPIIFLPKTGK